MKRKKSAKQELENEKQNQLGNLHEFSGEKLQNPEISPEQRAERAFLSGLLFEQTEQLTQSELRKRRKREKEIQERRIIEFQDGRKLSIKELINLVVPERQIYRALFPNDSDFFKEMFRLNWPDKDPQQYHKPYMASRYLIRTIYARFDKEIFIALCRLNPIGAGGFRPYKLSQYLNDEGKRRIIRFREEAIVMMKEFDDLNWYGFEKAYAKRFSLPFQVSIFDQDIR